MTQDPYGTPPEQPHPYGSPAGPPPPQPYAPPASAYGAPTGPTGPFWISYLGAEQGPYEYGQLAQMAVAGSIRSDTMVRTSSGQWFPVKQVPGVFSDKEFLTTAIISWFLGALGVDRFYLGYTGLGIAKLLTCGGLGVWALIDFILILLRKVPDANGRPLA